MKKLLLASLVSLFLMSSVTGCGNGSGGAVISADSGGSGSGNSSGGSSTGSSDGSGGDTGSTSGNTATNSVTFAWDAPVNSDGTPATNISGYKIHYGSSSRNYDQTVDIGSQTSCTVTELAPGTYYFCVSSYDASGNESAYSNEASKTIL